MTSALKTILISTRYVNLRFTYFTTYNEDRDSYQSFCVSRIGAVWFHKEQTTRLSRVMYLYIGHINSGGMHMAKSITIYFFLLFCCNRINRYGSGQKTSLCSTATKLTCTMSGVPWQSGCGICIIPNWSYNSLAAVLTIHSLALPLSEDNVSETNKT